MNAIKNQNKKYKLIAFDAYGTLLDVYSIKELAEDIFPKFGNKIANLWRDKQIEYTRLVSLSDSNPLGSKYYQSFWDLTELSLIYVCKKLKLNLTNNKKQKLLNQYSKLKCFDDCVPCLTQIKKMGFQTAILSNANIKMLDIAIKANKIDGYLDKLVSVEKAKQFKTSKLSYALLTQSFNVEKSEVLFISSNAWDVMGAQWFGFDTFWLNRQNLPFETLGEKPTHTAQCLEKILEVIE